MATESFEVVIRGENKFSEPARKAANDLRHLGEQAHRSAGAVRAARSDLGAFVRAARLAGDAALAAGGDMAAIGNAMEEVATQAQVVRTAMVAARGSLVSLVAVVPTVIVAATQLERAVDRLAQRSDALGRLFRWLRDTGVSDAAAVTERLLGLRRAQEFVASDTYRHRLREQGLTVQDLAEGYRRGQAAVERMTEAERSAAAVAERRIAQLRAQAAARAMATEMEAIVAFNIWQRQQWEEAAAARTRAFVEEAQRQAELIRLANEQALEAIEREERERLEAARAMLEEEARLAQETAELTRLANEQALEAIEREERERLEAARAMLEEEARARERALQPWLQFRDALLETFSEAILRARSFGDVLRGIGEMIANMLIRRGVGLLLNRLFPFLPPVGFAQGGVIRGLVAAQAGAVFTQPTLAAIAERPGMTELALPLPPGLRPEQLAQAVQRRELVLHLTIHNVLGDPAAVGAVGPSGAVAAVVNDISRRGPVYRAIRMVLP